MFTDIQIHPYNLTFNAFDRPHWHNCFFCGGYGLANWVVSRTNLDGYVLSDFACDHCAEQWRKAAKEHIGFYNLQQEMLLDVDAEGIWYNPLVEELV